MNTMTEHRTPPPGDPAAPATLRVWGRMQGSAARQWTLSQTLRGFVVHDLHGELLIPAREARRITVTRRWWRTRVSITGDPTRQRLGGLSRRDVRDLTAAVEALHQRSLMEVRLDAVTAWHAHVLGTLQRAAQELRWVPQETVAQLIRARPDAYLSQPSFAAISQLLTAAESVALNLTANEVVTLVQDTNQRILERSLQQHSGFFDSIETSPLTQEQARAVVTLDNRVHVIAAAGSGKTSVMVGRAAYAVHRGVIAPDRILLLAFNKDAALELQERVSRRFEAAGIPAGGVRATTFHAFGLDVIACATGRRPTVAPWVADGRDGAMVAAIVDELRKADGDFALKWDLFRTLYSRVSDDWTEELPADGWDRSTRTRGLQTYGGEVVRSQGERLIADWLYLNHVSYEYERPYPVNTSSARRRQYHPDFYYPDIDVWHEHWGVDKNGNPPPTWTGYREAMTWKRQLHRTHGSILLETTWAGTMDGSDFPRLAHELRSRGVKLRWDPNRVTRGAAPVKDVDVTRLVRTFMTHVKSNSLTRPDVARRLSDGRLRNTPRAQLFLDLYWRIHDAWQDRLAGGGYLDFEDMLVQAADHLEQGRYASGYEMVMVDEFQDASQARARLTRALVSSPGRYLLAVADDWPSINRFAGADLNVVQRFHEYFGPGPTLYLSTTFRCHQAISDVASAFVSKNPAQLTKTVTSVRTGPADPAAHEGVQVRQVSDAKAVPRALAAFLAELDAAVTSGAVASPGREMVTVDVLGRYRHDADLLPHRSYRNLRVTFRTIHSAKGLEADYVVVPNLTTGTYGFPSQITDDPVLNLAMTEPDPFEHAEERRLLYVALTRARRGAVLFAPVSTPSPFVVELLKAGTVRLVGGVVESVPCPKCGMGVMRSRNGKFGLFWGCSTFPRCGYTTNNDPSRPSTLSGATPANPS
jgi:DNA helicase-4